MAPSINRKRRAGAAGDGDGKPARVAKRSKVHEGHDTTPQKPKQPKTERVARTARATARTAVRKAQSSAARKDVVINEPLTQLLDVLVFGNGENGELGLGPGRTETAIPRLNPFLSSTGGPKQASAPTLNTVQLACGGMHTVALTSKNQIATWGVNDNGALGRPTAWEGGLKEMDEGSASDSDSDGALNPLESMPIPIASTAFPPKTNFVQVAAGDSCSLALTDKGQVYGWGTFKTPNGDEIFCYDEAGTLVERQTTPVLLRSLSGIIQIACGANHALALDNQGSVWTWGCADLNQLGRRLPTRHISNLAFPSLVPQPVGIRHVVAIGTGEYHAFAIDARGHVWGWGLNGFGEAGGDPRLAGRDGAPVVLPGPMKIKSLSGRNVVHLAGGAHHSAALTTDGTCLVWGRLDGGQLGLEFTPEQLADPSLIRHDERGKPRICLKPVSMDAIGAVAHVACGTDHTLFVTRAGTVYTTGFNAQGQLGLGNDNDDENNNDNENENDDENDDDDDDNDVYVAKQVGGKPIQKRHITWAGAGGQFSIVAGPHILPE